MGGRTGKPATTLTAIAKNELRPGEGLLEQDLALADRSGMGIGKNPEYEKVAIRRLRDLIV